MPRIQKFLLYFGMRSVIVAMIFILFSILRPSVGERVRFQSDEGHSLIGHFYAGDDHVVLIGHGFSSDSAYTHRVRSIIQSQNYSVMTFDFTGHGNSGGQVYFDNSRTERLANDVGSAIDFLVEGGFDSEKIILVGHSMGARSMLQYASREDSPKLGGLIMVGPEVNLNPNKQASFFTGAVDLDMAFAKRLSTDSPKAPVSIITSTWDDIHSPDNGEALLNVLNEGTGTYTRNLVVVPRVLHNYEFYSEGIVREIIDSANGMSGRATEPLTGPIFYSLYFWFVGVGLALTSSLFIWHGLKNKLDNRYEYQAPGIRTVIPFILHKLWIWMVGIICGGLIVGLVVLVPLEKPYFAVQFVVIVGGYGIVSMLMNRLGWMPGLDGQRMEMPQLKRVERSGLTAFTMTMFLILNFVLRISGFSMIRFTVDYFIWYIFFTLLMSIGFLQIGLDTEIVRGNKRGPRTLILWNVIKYFPFYVAGLFYLSMLSVSGMTSTFQGIGFLVFGIYCSKVVEKVSGNKYLAAMMIGLILAVPVGAMF